MRHHVKVHEWNEGKARRRVPLSVLAEFDFVGPEIIDGIGDVDTAKRMATEEIRRRCGARRIHGVSCIKGGGFTAVVSPPGGVA